MVVTTMMMTMMMVVVVMMMMMIQNFTFTNTELLVDLRVMLYLSLCPTGAYY
jgi:hypothetical protein